MKRIDKTFEFNILRSGTIRLAHTRIWWFALLLPLFFSGCKSSSWWANPDTLGPSTSFYENGATQTALVDPTRAPSQVEIQQILGEVQTLGRQDPALQSRLLAELQVTDTSLWPSIMESFRSQLAFSHQLHENEMIAAGRGKPKPVNLGETPLTSPQNGLAQTASPTTSKTTGSLSQPSGVTRLPAVDSTLLPVAPQQATRIYHLEEETNPASAPESHPAQKNLSGKSGDRQETPLEDHRLIRASFETGHEKTGPVPPLPTDSVPTDLVPAVDMQDAPVSSEDDKTALSQKKEAAPKPIATESTKEDWQTLLAKTIEQFEEEVPKKPQNQEEYATLAKLRMLQLVAGRRREAIAPFATGTSDSNRDFQPIDATVADFWAFELFGLDLLLDGNRIPQADRRSAEAKRHLLEAANALGATASLEICNMAFCRSVDGFGATIPIDDYQFTASQPVLIYAEIDNFKSVQTPKGFHTSLKIGYQIFDGAGRLVERQDAVDMEEYCQNLRHDFFFSRIIRLPERIYPGRHQLKLTVEDLNGNKVGESSLAFEVAQSADR